jgi:toxin ParE1/3/4
MRIIYRPLARKDTLQVTEYLVERNQQAAERFIDCVERDIDALAQHPGMGTKRLTRAARLKGLRSLPVTRYRKYLIFYIPIEDGIEVVRVLHGARRVDRLLREE